MRLLPLLPSAFLAAHSLAGTTTPALPAPPQHADLPIMERPWFTGRSFSLGAPLNNPLLGSPQSGGLGLANIWFPHLHINQAYGGSSAANPADLATGAHDPNADGWTLQGIEAESSFRFNRYFEGFTGHHFYWDQASGWNYEHDESFLKIKSLPGGFELRGGQFFNRFGFHNATHLHGWDFTDSFLVNNQLLGDHSVTTRGAEITWNLPIPWQSALSFSAGNAVVDDHNHGHDDEHEHDSATFESHGAAFQDLLLSANWTNLLQINDFHRLRFGASGAWGDNQFNRTTHVYGLHAEYEWRENGLEPGGDYFRWRSEAMFRRFGAVSGPLPGESSNHSDHDDHDDHDDHASHDADHHDEEEHHDDHDADHDDHSDHDDSPQRRSFSDFGIYSYALYGHQTGFAGPLELALRAEYTDGIADAGLENRFRLTPSARLFFNKAATVSVGLQYNWDRFSNSRDEHSLWTQLSFDWGGPEVR